MQPSEIIKQNEIANCKEVIKNGTADEKKAAKARLKELEGESPIAKAQLATDEQPE